jgi:succinate dehydrogenase/fumarate reductase flavoprotein subunit
MSDIKKDLQQVIEETMLPESEAYLEELHEEYKKGVIDDEDKEAIQDLESFLVELQNILLAIEEDKISDDEADEIYTKIITMLNEHSEMEH